MTAGYPAALLRSVSLPVYQVVPAAAPTAHVQKLPDGIGRMVIDEPRGWKKETRDWN